MTKLLLISLFTFSTLASAGALTDLNGNYNLINKRGDDGQFTPECTEKLQVTVDLSNRSILASFQNSSSTITGIRFKNIGQGPLQDYGDRGTYNTIYSQNKVIETYEAESFFSSYKRIKVLEIQNNILTISMKTSDREIDMECTYRK